MPTRITIRSLPKRRPGETMIAHRASTVKSTTLTLFFATASPAHSTALPWMVVKISRSLSPRTNQPSASPDCERKRPLEDDREECGHLGTCVFNASRRERDARASLTRLRVGIVRKSSQQFTPRLSLGRPTDLRLRTLSQFSRFMTRVCPV